MIDGETDTHRFLLVDEPLVHFGHMEHVIARQDAYTVARREHLEADRTLELLLNPRRQFGIV